MSHSNNTRPSGSRRFLAMICLSLISLVTITLGCLGLLTDLYLELLIKALRVVVTMLQDNL